MLILLKHILRNIRENKFRSVLIILSLAISTMVLFMNLTIKDDIMTKYTSVLQGAYQNYDLDIYCNNTTGIGYFNQKDIDLSGIKADHILASSFAYGYYMKDDENITVNLSGMDRQLLQDTGLLELEKKSNSFDSKDDSQIVVSQKTAKKYHWKLNDTITIYAKDGKHKLKITGIAKPAGLYLTEFNGIMMMTTGKFASLSAAKGDKITDLVIDLPKGADVKKVKAKLEKANPKYIVNSVVDQESVESALKTINQLLMIVLFMVIGLNIFIISSITKLIMATRIPVVGTFRSVGASRWKMNLILIFENSVYGILGAAIGIILGVLIRNPISAIFIQAGDALDHLNIRYDFKISYIVLPVLFAIGLQILITLSSVLKAGRRSIKDSIFNTLNTKARVSKKKTIIGIILLLASAVIYILNRWYSFVPSILALAAALFGAVFLLPLLTKYLAQLFSAAFGKIFGGPAGLGMKNISFSKTTRSSITLITVGFSLILLVFGAVSSIYKLLGSTYMPYDIQINGLSQKTSDYDFLKKLDGVERTDFEYYSYMQGKINRKSSRFILVGTDRYYGGLEGKKKLLTSLKKGEALMDRFYANKNGWSVGDQVTLKGDDFKNKKQTFRIAGFIDCAKFSSLRSLFIITEDDYFKNISSIPSVIEVYTNKNNKKVKKLLDKKLAGTGANVETVAEVTKQNKESTQSLFGMIGIILGLSILLAVFGLINNQMIGFIQRKREYAVLYSVSMSKAQLRKMIFFESFGTFLAGILFASVLCRWLMQLLFGVLMSIGMGFPIDLKLSYMLQIGGIVLAILLVTTISPIRKISKMDIVNELKYE